MRIPRVDPHGRPGRPSRLERALLAVAAGGLALFALWPWLPGLGHSRHRTLVVYGFSILGEVMNEGIFPAFQDEWRARTGEELQVISSFASSGTVTNQLILGVPAEVAILSLELDALRLLEHGVLDRPAWRELPHRGILNQTPFVILVRRANPRRIEDFSDLARPGVGVVHPDPLTSGGALWAVLAEYGSAFRRRGDAEMAYRQLLGIWRNVIAQAGSARAARTQFENGFGDALVTYEQEVIRDRARGRLDGDVVYPPSTVFSEHTVVVVEKNVGPAQRELVRALVDFLWSDAGQRIFVEYGFRSLDPALNRANPAFEPIQDPFRIDDMGGWVEAKRSIIEAVWKDRVLPAIGK